jgi:outer membrane protein assembly factor BamA
VEFADPALASSSTVHFVRNTAQFNTYVPTKFLDTVWATSLGGGYLYNTNDQDDSKVPEVKVFKLGGRDTIRGYDPNEIPPTKDKYGHDVEVTKDSFYYLLKSEFRVPVYGSFESVFFYDGGLVQIHGNSFYYPYRDAVGIGIRYQTPVGPLNIEYGQKLERDPHQHESAGRFHLSFGTF